MGRPVVHFEVIGSEGERSRAFYSELFDWRMDADNAMAYGIVSREENLTDDGIGIGGGVSGGLPGYPGHLTFYVEVPDVEEALAHAERLGGTRTMGPDEVMEGLVVGLFRDPDGHTVGVLQDIGA